jgi:hypothetical protein
MAEPEPISLVVKQEYYKATTMPPAADESHPPPGIPDEPEDAEGEESDEYDIEVGGCSLF